MYNYLVTAKPATIISHSCTGHFYHNDQINTLLIKGNNIEIYSLTTENGFSKTNSLPIYGRIIEAKLFRPPSCTTDHLFCLTQKFTFCIIAVDDNDQIITKASGNLNEQFMKPSNAGAIVSIDPSQMNIIISLYKGHLIYIRLNANGEMLANTLARRIPINELNILSMVFMDSNDFNTHENISYISSSSSIITEDQSQSSETANINTNEDDNLSLKTNAKLKSKKAALKIKSKINSLQNKLNKRKKVDVFIEGPKLPICILYEDYQHSRILKTYVIDCGRCELMHGAWDTLMVEEVCSKVVAVPRPLCGILFIGQYSIAYRNGDNCQRVQVPDGDYSCWDIIDREHGDDVSENTVDKYITGSRYLLGDSLNCTLNTLVLRYNSITMKVNELFLETLGNCVAPSCISYIDAGYAFIASISGDHVLIRIHDNKNWKKQLQMADDEDIDIIDNEEEDNTYDVEYEGNGFIEIIARFTCLGPIQDLVAVDLERQGQCQIVLYHFVLVFNTMLFMSGIEEVAEIEMNGIQGIWTLTESTSSVYHKYLITSFVSETRVLVMIEDEGLEEIEMSGLDSDVRTVYCSNVINDNFIQITETNINLIELLNNVNNELFAKCDEWNTGHLDLKINSAISNLKQILIAVSNGHLFLLEIEMDDGKHYIKCVADKMLEHEISCVCLSPTENNDKSLFGAVGLWKDHTIRIISLSDFQLLLNINLNTDIVPRSVLFTTFSLTPANMYLFVGMGDGSLIETQLNISHNKIEISKQKKITLGTQPVRLTPFTCNNISYIFSGCDQPTIIYKQHQQMFYANINLGEINFISEFNTKDFSDCLAMSVEGSLMIGRMDKIQKLHIKKIPLLEQPRRISYHKSEKLYLLATQVHTQYPISTYMNTDIDTNTNSNDHFFHPIYNQTIYKLHLIDNQSFDILYTKQLPPFWNITRIITHCFKCDPNVTYFIISSSYIYPYEKNCKKSRIEIAMVTSTSYDTILSSSMTANSLLAGGSTSGGRILKIVNTTEFSADIYCIRALSDNYLLAGVRSKIQILKWTAHQCSDNEYPFTLQHLQTMHSHSYVLDIKVFGDFFIICDLMKSISMFLINTTGGVSECKNDEIIDGTKNKVVDKIVVSEVARDYDPSWMRTCEIYNDQYIIGIDSWSNMFALKRNIDSINEDERGKLDVIARVHWGEDINIICHGSLVMDIPTDMMQMEVDDRKMDYSGKQEMVADDDDDDVKVDDQCSEWYSPVLKSLELRKCIFGTVEGSVGVLLSLPYHRYRVLEKVQAIMSTFIQGVGSFKHQEWRKFETERESHTCVGFIDGDFIEMFLSLEERQKVKVAQEMDVPLKYLVKIVEEMTRLH